MATSLVVGLVGRGQGEPPTRLDLRAGGAWVASPSVGLLTLIDGASAEVVARVRVGDQAPGWAAAQDGLVGYAVDRDRGLVSRVDPRTFVPTAPVGVIDRASGDVATYATADVLYVLDQQRGRLAMADARDLSPRGGGVASVAEEVASSALDNQGRLWLLGRSSGDLVWFDGHRRHDRPEVVARPRTAELVVVGGAPVVVDRAGRRVHRIGASGRFGADACLDVDPADDTIRFGGSSRSEWVYAVSGEQGVLRVSDLGSGACAGVAIPVAEAGDQLGAPIESAGRVFVPDYTTSTVIVVDVEHERVAETGDLGAAGVFELFDEDGIVFYNDPKSEKAGVIHIDASFTAVAKYNPDNPNEGVTNVTDDGKPESPTTTPSAEPPPPDEVADAPPDQPADEPPPDGSDRDPDSVRPPRPDERVPPGGRPPGGTTSTSTGSPGSTTTTGPPVTGSTTTTTLLGTPNAPPEAPDTSVTTDEDNQVTFTLPATDIENDPLRFTTTQPGRGSVSCSGAQCTYTPDINVNGSDSFTYTARDTSGAEDSGTVSVTIRSVNDAPTAVPVSFSMATDTSRNFTVTAADPEGDPITFAIESAPVIPGVGAGCLANGDCVISWNSSQTGNFTFTFRATDSGGDFDIGNIAVTVTP